jgi:hypothetical protein
MGKQWRFFNFFGDIRRFNSNHEELFLFKASIRCVFNTKTIVELFEKINRERCTKGTQKEEKWLFRGGNNRRCSHVVGGQQQLQMYT